MFTSNRTKCHPRYLADWSNSDNPRSSVDLLGLSEENVQTDWCWRLNRLLNASVCVSTVAVDFAWAGSRDVLMLLTSLPRFLTLLAGLWAASLMSLSYCGWTESHFAVCSRQCDPSPVFSISCKWQPTFNQNLHKLEFVVSWAVMPSSPRQHSRTKTSSWSTTGWCWSAFDCQQQISRLCYLSHTAKQIIAEMHLINGAVQQAHGMGIPTLYEYS